MFSISFPNQGPSLSPCNQSGPFPTRKPSAASVSRLDPALTQVAVLFSFGVHHRLVQEVAPAAVHVIEQRAP